MPSTSDVADIRAAERDRYDRCWKNQVVYCPDVETFLDADGDGVGDFQGLVNRADYLEELGIDCVWLMPFYPSAQLDDGYDVTDYLVRRYADPVRKTIENLPEIPSGLPVGHFLTKVFCPWAPLSDQGNCPISRRNRASSSAVSNGLQGLRDLMESDFPCELMSARWSSAGEGKWGRM